MTSEIRNQKSEITYRPGLHAFAVAFVAVTFLLLILGGTVTSTDAGLSVPDWPESYHYNMFTFPVSMWKGGILFEHTHRLLASAVGVLSIVLAIWLWRTQGSRRWLRNVGLFALALVVVQGFMGGLRVSLFPHSPGGALTLAVLHGITGQLFLCTAVLIAAATGRLWIDLANAQAADARYPVLPRIDQLETTAPSHRFLQMHTVVLLFVFALIIQLTLGAVMRHTKSGLAIPDFPAAYGRVVPPFDDASIHRYIDAHYSFDAAPPYFHGWQVTVHFAHRAWALVVIGMTGWVAVRIGQAANGDKRLTRPLLAILVLLVVQIALGASVIWSERWASLATAHQATGAAILATAALLLIRVNLLIPGVPRRRVQPVPHTMLGAPVRGGGFL